MKSIFRKIISFKNWFLQRSLLVKVFIVIILFGIGWLVSTKLLGSKNQQVQYETTQAERGTLVVSISASGQVSSTNNSSVTTQATGVVSELYVKDGDLVKVGDKIAEIDLDLSGQQNSTQALASYQSAQNILNSAKANLYSLQSSMFTDWDTFMNIAQNSMYQNADGTPNEINRSLPEFHIAKDDWLAAEAIYKNQQNVVNQAQTAVNSTRLSYQKASSIVYAPITGKISALSIHVGSVITSSQSTSSTSTTTTQSSGTKIASVTTDAPLDLTVNLSEIDIPKIKIGDRATIKIDALSEKTFTGKVYSIDAAGSVSSGVTTYPVVIAFDTASSDIHPNMSATANIIVLTRDNVILIPSSAVQTQNGQSTVRVKKDGQITSVVVEIGESSDTQTEITSGISQGDEIVVNTISSGNGSTNSSSSPFSPFGGGRGGFNMRTR
ncbi:hypothetical protein A2866_02905 [Candidatus Roizmanbacteria bacterium RIFCSPHIGHO2_01_FULL_39_8]|uniref:Uncharacterized protein n=2 Tax=Candidatus Roizmaniibacteriota TaxID=1752723 RepID=A0A1F7GGR3_9BACT|nr:MAG: hypothetical protein A2866_02905 [Candidatus Roizmanbacteria bacterium RIFCSPHIGHO2_01_FULL_39_8]OGK27560.1 MAG: hypothetical protein A3C28_06030 [Candidatus Roizmanbacteria bacterium RIFCSPHIGHO2_02_FULL_39_9]